MGRESTDNSEAKTRIRYGSLPELPASPTMHFADCRPELRDISFAQRTQLYLNTSSFKAVIAPKLEAIDAEHRGTGRGRCWTAHELETIFVYSRMAKKRSIKEGLRYLAGDPRGRRLLGFTTRRGRRRVGRRTIHECLPSEMTMSRHLRQRWDEIEHADLYCELDRQLEFELLEIEEFREEARIMDMDGTSIDIHHSADRTNRITGEVTKGTAPEAGYVALGNPKSGTGFHVVHMSSKGGTIWPWALEPRDVGETRMAAAVIEAYMRDVAPRLRQDATNVISTDGAFNSNAIRASSIAAGLTPNIHKVSHANDPETRALQAAADAKRIPIDDRGQNPAYTKWFANGHHELVCRCEKGRVEKDIRQKDGKPIISSRGRCKSCGDVRITVGKWRLVQNWKRSGQAAFVPCERHQEPTLTFGNPLTFNDPLADKYGKARFAHQEGLHGALVNGYQLIKGKRWFRRKAQAELDCALVFSIMKVLALEKHKRAARPRNLSALPQPRAGSPPGLPLAA